MKLYRFIIVLLGVICFSTSCVGGKEKFDLPKREFRGAWLHVVGNKTIATMSVDQIQGWFLNTLDSLKMTGCNAVIFQVRPTADALYKSKFEPWSRYLTGVQGKSPEPYWDPLQFMIEESHKRGMELHAWCNPYRVTLEETDTLCADHLYFKNPEIFVKHGKQLYFNPCEPASREHTVKVISDIVANYDVDAVHFDDYFYPYPIEGEEFDDQAAYEKYGALAGYTGEQMKGDWRRYNVTLLMKELNAAIKSIKPWVRFGISPFGIHRNKKDTPDGSGSETNGLSNYEQLFADVPLWLEEGYIDYNVPQLYWKIGHDRADYEILINWWNDTKTKGHLYIGQSISTFNEPDLQNPKTTQMARKMELVRELDGVDGNVWWPGWSILKNRFNIADSLIVTHQRYKALIPAYNWIDSKAPAAVASIAKDGRVMRWKQSDKQAEDPMQQALFYVVYCFPNGVDANKVNMQNPEFIKCITNKCEYNVIEENPNHGAGCKYFVTVVDRCWNESAPSAILWY